MTHLYKCLQKVIAIFVCFLFTQQVFAEKDTVTNVNDSGLGSLRAAIDSCNGRAQLDTIVFALTEGESFTINLTSALPTISQPLFIDGYSQSGASAGTIAARTIRININAAGGTGNTFIINADNVTIAGLAIYGSPGYAIDILNGADNIHIWGNYIGTDSTGLNTTLANAAGGIVCNLSNFTHNNTNIVIGTNGDGTADANEGNLVCNSTGGAGNGDGIVLWYTDGAMVAGNIIGLDKNGDNTGMGNGRNGILVTVSASSNVIGSDGDGVSDNLEGNRIAANGEHGIHIAANSDNNIIAGNIIGLDASNAAAGNVGRGIELLNCSSNRVGTNGDGTSDNLEPNIICSNAIGVAIVTYDFFGFNNNANSNVIAGNAIGTDTAGTLVRGNTGSGILLSAELNPYTVNDNIIGSNFDGNGDAAEGNLIANNGSGITVNTPVVNAFCTGNKFARNRIYDNTGIGIDLANDGVTANDDGDGDTGANDLFNAPVLLTSQIDGSNNLVITGFSRPGSVIEFYVADAGPNPDPLPGGYTKSFGEGETFLFRAVEEGTLGAISDDSTGVTNTYDGTDEGTGTGGTRTESKFSFTVPVASLPVSVTAGTRITALAYANTSGAGSTSEFGGVLAATVTPVNLTSFKGRLYNGKAELTWTTAEEYNNSHFNIERSSNGSVYTTIGAVAGKGSFNNTYNFTDNSPLEKISYYRLKQVDIDGQSTYSRVLVIRNDAGIIKASVAPNPFTGFINISWKLEKEERISIRLFDQSGRTVKTFTTQGYPGINTINISGLENLQPGSYILELTGASVSFRQQLLKE